MREYIDPGDQKKGTKRRPKRQDYPPPDQPSLFQPTGPTMEDVVASVPASKIQGMVRAADPTESQYAAINTLGELREIQVFVEALFAIHGPMTDYELEHLPEALVLRENGKRKYPESTLRKRRCELRDLGRVVKCEYRRDAKSVWKLAP